MSDWSLAEFRTHPQATPVTIRLQGREWVGITGTTRVGKSRLLDALQQRYPRRDGLYRVDPSALSGRTTLQALAKAQGADRAAVVLSMLGLWDKRRDTIGSLSPAERAVAAWIPALVQPLDAVLSDGETDRLDPWVLPSLLEELKKLDAVKVLVSVRPDVLEHCERLIVLNERGLRFDGGPGDLIRIVRPQEILVETEDPGPVAALIEPLQLRVDVFPGGLRIETTEGQALAAELALKGYPHLRVITVKSPTLTEALRTLIRPTVRS